MRTSWILAAVVTVIKINSSYAARSDKELIHRGDQAFRQREQIESARQALESYKSVEKVDASSLWRTSMAHQFLGMRGSLDSEQKIQHFSEGLEAGRAALALSPDCAECHFWTAINLALLSQERGIYRSLRSLKEVRALLQKAKELDPAYAFGGPDRILGKIETAIPKVLGGDRLKAREHFESAINASPDEPMNYLELAKLYLEKYDDKAKALAAAEKGLQSGHLEADRIESRESRAELFSLAQQIKQNF